MLIPAYHQILKSINDRESPDPVLRMFERSLSLGNARQSWTLLGFCLDREVIRAEEANQLATLILGRVSDVEGIKREFDRPFWRFWSHGGYRGAFRRYLKAHPLALQNEDGATEFA